MVAADDGEPRRGHGAWGTEGGRRGLEAWTNGIIGSQVAFPEIDYWASLIRPLLMISFFGSFRKVDLLLEVTVYYRSVKLSRWLNTSYF